MTSPDETPVTTKSTSLSPDRHKTSQNSSNLAHASADDFYAVKFFVVDQTYMLKKNYDQKQILLNNESKALINNVIDQIEFLKNELGSKDTIINPIIKNSKYNNEYFQNKSNNDSNQTEKFFTPKNLQNSKQQTINILTTLHPSTVLKY